MREYIARRLLLFLPTIVLASLAIFGAMRVLPGDVASAILTSEEAEGGLVTKEQFRKLREKLGLNDPLPVQYGKWVWSMVNGQFGGASLITNEPISELVGRRSLVTLQLAAYTIALSMAFALPAGVIAAVKQDTWADYLVRSFSILGHALPNFWVALMVILALVLFFHWSPPLRYRAVWDDPILHLEKVLWPVLILAWSYSANVTRVTRSNMLEVLRQDYIRTARSKGLRERIVFWRHALKNALIPVITLAGLQLEGLLSGTVILEALFGLPGMGQGIIESARLRDYPVIQSLTLFLVLIALALNLLVDLLYAYIDPRISYAR